MISKNQGLNSSSEYLKIISSSSFGKIAKEKIRQYVFSNLLKEKRTLSKLDKLRYSELTMQSYLFDKKTTINEKITVFKWRSRMENTFGENFRGGRDTVICKLCGSHTDSQEEGFKTYILTRDLARKSEQ